MPRAGHVLTRPPVRKKTSEMSEDDVPSAEPARADPERAPRGARALGRAEPIAAFALVALLAGILIGALDSAHYAPTSDDGYYLRYMSAVADGGPSVFPSLFERWNATPVDWVHPPPTRIAFVIAAAGLSLLLGQSLTTLSWLSLLSHLAWTTSIWCFSRPRLGAGFALALTALCGFSPLLMGLARLALMDSFACLTMTLALWSFLAALERPERHARKVAFGAAFALAILSKELSVFLLAPLTAMVLLERFERRAPLSLGAFALALAVPALACGGLFVAAAGGLQPLLTTTHKVLTTPATNRYALEYCSGPWYRYFIDYLALSPFPTIRRAASADASGEPWTKARRALTLDEPFDAPTRVGEKGLDDGRRLVPASGDGEAACVACRARWCDVARRCAARAPRGSVCVDDPARLREVRELSRRPHGRRNADGHGAGDGGDAARQ